MGGDDTLLPNRPVLGGRYELLGLLGAGGMGNVYKAHDLELDELVAVKVLLPHLVATPGALQRFRREVRLARRVTHPNVARVFDIGEVGGDRLLTMELVDGESLAACMRRKGCLAPHRAVEIARSIAAGVRAAHEAGVIHRDLKPDNVLVARDGRIVITDFGIARAAAEGGATQGLLGTPAYMAPEQVDGEQTIDHRADVYAFGAILYEMVVGEAAWQGASVWQVVSARLLQPPPDPRDENPGVPDDLAELILRCLAREPDARYGEMAEVEEGLAGLVLPSAPSSSALSDARTPQPAFVTTGTDKRVAVLPLVNQGPADQAYVADGLTEDLIDALSMARGLRVRSLGTVVKYRGRSQDPRDVGRDLDVQVIVEGSVRRGPSGYRIRVGVTSVADGFQLWARRFDVAEGDLLTQNDAIAREVAAALSVDLATPDRAVHDADAVHLYLRARQAYKQIFATGSDESVVLFDELLAMTPDDPRAWAGRAMAGAHQEVWPQGEERIILRAAERAVELAPSLPEGHLAIACVHAFDGAPHRAVAPARRALALSPANAEAHEVLGRVLSTSDDPACEQHLQAAVDLEPELEFAYISYLAWLSLHERDEDVEALFEQIDRTGLQIRIMIESRLVFWRRDRTRAEELLASLDRSHPRAMHVLPWLELVLGAPPGPPPGMPPVPPGMRRPAMLRWFVAQNGIEIAAFGGDVEVALAGLTALDADGCEDVAWLERCPLLDTLRSDPRYAELRDRFAARAKLVLDAYHRPQAS